MAALPNVGGAICESSGIPFLYPATKEDRRKKQNQQDENIMACPIRQGDQKKEENRNRSCKI